MPITIALYTFLQKLYRELEYKWPIVGEYIWTVLITSEFFTNFLVCTGLLECESLYSKIFSRTLNTSLILCTSEHNIFLIVLLYILLTCVGVLWL